MRFVTVRAAGGAYVSTPLRCFENLVVGWVGGETDGQMANLWLVLQLITPNLIPFFPVDISKKAKRRKGK